VASALGPASGDVPEPETSHQTTPPTTRSPAAPPTSGHDEVERVAAPSSASSPVSDDGAWVRCTVSSTGTPAHSWPVPTVGTNPGPGAPGPSPGAPTSGTDAPPVDGACGLAADPQEPGLAADPQEPGDPADAADPADPADPTDGSPWPGSMAVIRFIRVPSAA